MFTLIIDSNNLFIRNYTVNPFTDVNGNPLGGVAGTLVSLRSMISILKPSKVILVWDGEGGSAKKRQLFKEYKQGRKPITFGRNYQFGSEEKAKENVKWQLQQVRQLISHLPVIQIETKQCEADDAIAYLAKYRDFFSLGKVIIASCDKDFYQLIEEGCVVFNPQSKKLFSTKQVLDQFGIHPSNWLLYKSLSGDTSDNVDGVKGIAEKTVVKLFPDVAKEEKIDLSLLEKMIEEDLEKKEKKGNHNKLQKIQESWEIVKRNWKICSLDSILMSLTEKDRITKIVEAFELNYSPHQFHVDVVKLGGLPLSGDYFQPFLHLKALSKGEKN